MHHLKRLSDPLVGDETIPIHFRVLLVALLLIVGGCGPSNTVEPCELGSWDHDEDATTACVAWMSCPMGTHVLAPGSATRDQMCAPCIAGTYTSEPDQSTCLTADACAAGTVQTAATNSAPPVCTPCVAGQYCAGGATPATACDENAATWDLDADPATTCVERTECAAGTHVVAEGNATTNRMCAACVSGTYSPATNAATCTSFTPCMAGTYVVNAGSTWRDQTCAVCPDGTYTSGANQSQCLDADACLAGTIQTNVPGTAPPECDACAPGVYCAGGTVAAIDCEANTAWDHDADPATECLARTDCAPGYHIVFGGDATHDRTCDECDSGTFSSTPNATTCTSFSICTAGLSEAAPGTSTMDRACMVGLWTRQFGTAATDRANSVAVDGSGSVYVGGTAGEPLPGQTENGSYVRKYDDEGAVEWTRQFGTSLLASVQGLAVSGDEYVYAAGSTYSALPGQTSSGIDDVFLRKYDKDGTEVWTRQFGTAAEDRATSVAIDATGNVYVVGYVGNALPSQVGLGGESDAFVRKYDAAGTPIWTRQFGTNREDRSGAVAVDDSGNVFVAGTVFGALPDQTHVGGLDVFVRKYDSAGNLSWTRQFGTASNEGVSSVAVDSAGSVFLAGYTGGTLPGQTRVGDAVNAIVWKYDGTGAEVWSRQFGDNVPTVARSVFVDSANQVYITGYTVNAFADQTPQGLEDAYVRMYDNAGSVAWTRQFGTTQADHGQAITGDASGNLYVVGETLGTFPRQTAHGTFDVFLKRLVL